ncbi:MAG: hypothetical protein QXN04_09380 [Pyrobaculum sp.]
MLISFLAGLLLGRQFGGRVEEVDPKLVFIPMGEAPQLDLKKALVEGFIRAGLSNQEARALAEELMRHQLLTEVDNLIKKRDFALHILRQASQALEDGRISPATYGALVRKYLIILAETEEKLGKIKDTVLKTINEVSLAVLTPQGLDKSFRL